MKIADFIRKDVYGCIGLWKHWKSDTMVVENLRVQSIKWRKGRTFNIINSNIDIVEIKKAAKLKLEAQEIENNNNNEDDDENGDGGVEDDDEHKQAICSDVLRLDRKYFTFGNREKEDWRHINLLTPKLLGVYNLPFAFSFTVNFESNIKQWCVYWGFNNDSNDDNENVSTHVNKGTTTIEFIEREKGDGIKLWGKNGIRYKMNKSYFIPTVSQEEEKKENKIEQLQVERKEKDDGRIRRMTKEEFEKNIQETNVKVGRIGYANLDSSFCGLCDWDWNFSGHFHIEFGINESKNAIETNVDCNGKHLFSFEPDSVDGGIGFGLRRCFIATISDIAVEKIIKIKCYNILIFCTII